jgi:hypothetical protein
MFVSPGLVHFLLIYAVFDTTNTQGAITGKGPTAPPGHPDHMPPEQEKVHKQ